MEASTFTHLKVTRIIPCYLKGTVDFGHFYSNSDDFNLVGYYNGDYAGDIINDRKSTSDLVFF